jgi:K+-transporting ATPase KdpF subunit
MSLEHWVGLVVAFLLLLYLIYTLLEPEKF